MAALQISAPSGCSVLITGASGLLGRSIYDAFKKSGKWGDNAIMGTAFSRAHGDLIKLDINDFAATKSFIEKKRPTYIVHAAAQRFPDQVEKQPEASQKLNVEAAGHLAKLLKDVNGKMVYISTDYVFDGKSPPFNHDSPTHPLNEYGRMKRDGENAILKEDINNMVLRIPVLYGDVEYLEESAITVLFKQLKNMQGEANSEKVKMSDYEIRRPSHVKDIANIVHKMLLLHAKDSSKVPGGIYQWCGEEPMTKYEMVSQMADVFSLSKSNVAPIKEPSGGAPRPHDTTMNCERVKQLLSNISGHSSEKGEIDDQDQLHTKFSEGIKSCLKKWI